MRQSKVEFYFCAESIIPITAFLADWGLDGYTIEPVNGVWKGEVEPYSFRLTVFRDTDSQAHTYHGPNGDIHMPAIVDHVELWARRLAENLAYEFKQDAVGFSIQPTFWELTTVQAKYKRVG